MPQLIEGFPVQVPGKAYFMRNVGGVYDCSCVAWKMQSRPIDLRTCKHLCEYLGVESERARVGNENMPTKYKKGSTTNFDLETHEALHRKFVALKAPALAATAPAATPAPKKSYPCLLAESYKDGMDPTGWWMSEKLDGVRAIWDGTDFRTRNNNVLFAPDWFKKGMPKERLDGEFWLGRNLFQETMSVVRRHSPNGEWKKIKYRVFDAPDATGDFEDRMDHLNKMNLPVHVQVVIQFKCSSEHHLGQFLKTITDQGGEGIMLRKPHSQYEARRSSTLLKVKPFHDMEVRVVGHTAGKGKHKGVLGALVCEHNGHRFNVGGGFTDAWRANPPAVGTTITIKYQNLTKKGVPRHASFLRVYQTV
jgi:DNA ligase-1